MRILDLTRNDSGFGGALARGSALLSIPVSLIFVPPICDTSFMPKRISKSDDVNQAAYQMVRRSTETEDREPHPPKVSLSDISRVMAAMGRKGGKVGGKRRLTTMTAEQRHEVAKKAAQARWAKHIKE